MCLCTFVGADLTYSRGVAAINKVGGGTNWPMGSRKYIQCGHNWVDHVCEYAHIGV